MLLELFKAGMNRQPKHIGVITSRNTRFVVKRASIVNFKKKIFTHIVVSDSCIDH